MSQGARKYLVFFVLLLGLAVFCAMGRADQEKAAAPDEKPPVVAEEAKKSKLEDLTKEKLLEKLYEDLDDEDILPMVPGLGKVKDASGAEHFAMTSRDGSVRRAEDLSRQELIKLLQRVRQAATLVRTQNIQRQLEQIQQMRNIQNLQNLQRMQTQIQRPPEVPRTPPAQPRTPTPPPQTYNPPPQPPRRPER